MIQQKATPASGATGTRAYIQSPQLNCTEESEPVQVILDRLEGVKSAGEGKWSGRCPAHDDARNSLSIGRGDDGRCLVHCFAGCSPEAILAAVGLSIRDLFPRRSGEDKLWRNNRPEVAFPRRLHRSRRQEQAKAPKQTPGERTAQLCFDRLIDRRGYPAKVWEYLDACWKTCGYILRWDTRTGKDIRPISCGLDGRWRVGAMPEPRPLYRLPFIRELGMDDSVYITEGEKAADALVGVGLESTTASGGANAPRNTDWTPLAGRQVTIWPDNDPPGLGYADTVASILTSLDPPATVKILDPKTMGLTAKQDAADFVQKRGTL